jgi:hypothetical protein
MPKIKNSPEVNQLIISLYLSGKDTYQILKQLSCSQTFILNTLKRNNIARRTTQSYTTKYISNDTFFDTIDTEEKAYILGFLYADGNNYVNGNHSYEISIKLQLKDKIILEKIKNILSTNSIIKEETNKKTLKQYCHLKINSKAMSDSLSAIGCIPNKSLKLVWPEQITDPKISQHFLRGYSDGDGSIYCKKPSKTGHVNYFWQITSTNNFCQYVKQYIAKSNINCSISLSKPKTNKITSTLLVGGNIQMAKILNWLYSDATIYLPRKYEKYLEFIQSSSSKSSSSSSTSRSS